MQDFRKLRVWKAAHDLTTAVYRVTQGFPREERYGLTSQLRGAAASVPSNLAEGCGRGSRRDTAQFFQVAMGSACEVEYQLLLARDLGYLALGDHANVEAAVKDVKRMLAGLLARVRGKARAQPQRITDNG